MAPILNNPINWIFFVGWMPLGSEGQSAWHFIH